MMDSVSSLSKIINFFSDVFQIFIIYNNCSQYDGQNICSVLATDQTDWILQVTDSRGLTATNWALHNRMTGWKY